MRIKIYFALGILSFYKDVSLVHGKSVAVSAVDENIQRQFENYMNCARQMNSSECLEITGRKRKGSENAGNNVVIIGGAGSHEHGSFDDGYFVEIEDDDDHGGKKGKRKRRGKKKKNKGSKKIYKKMRPLLYGMGGLKLLFDHFLLKKLAFVSLFTFILSKISFILAALVALKQFFHTPTSHQRAEHNKVEVIHIPIRKYKTKNHYDGDFEESKLIPVTYTSDSLIPDTTPSYYTFSGHNDFISSEENFNDNFMISNSENNDKSNDNDDDDDNFDRSDKFTNEKNYYLNHVHSPFV